MSKVQTCWILFDAEKKGSENQCRGLAEALGIKDYSLKPIAKSIALNCMPRHFWFPFLNFQKGLLSDISYDDLPDLVISSGTRASVVAAFLKKNASENIRVINILNPRLPHECFDLIITPEHDRLKGPNILTTLGSLHSITPETLNVNNTKYQKDSKSPIVSILLGGPSKSFTMDKNHFEVLGQQVAHLHRSQQARFLVSFSRRTPNDFKEVFLKITKRIPLEFYDPAQPKGANPYVSYLGLADHIIVSADSISMVAEACSTGKPVHIMRCPKMPRKFKHFHKALEKNGSTKPFKGTLEKWDVVPLRETQRVAQEVHQRLSF